MCKKGISHIDHQNRPKMVDVGRKKPTFRTAHASSIVIVPKEVLSELENGDIKSPKGPVFQTAIVAGTMACKKTSELIPFCHPLGLDVCNIEISINEEQKIIIDCKVSVYHKTGVEMEALTGASIAALTIYDMCKALSHDIIIKDTRLIEKYGGKSDYVCQQER